MNGSDIVRVIISPRAAHPFRRDVVRHDFAVVRELFMTDGALPVLLGNLAVQQLPHFGWGAEFAKSSEVVRVFNAPYAAPQNLLFAMRPFAAAAEARAVDRTVFVSAEFHRQRSRAVQAK